VKVRRLAVGPLAANCYLVWREGGTAGLVIDPGAEPESILAALAEERLRPEVIAATHCHADHIAAVNELLDAFPEAVFAVGAPEAEWPGRPACNLSYGFGLPIAVRAPARLLGDGEEFSAGGLAFKALAVPGHSPGSLAFHCAAGRAVFTGDALFAGDIGRADLPGGDERQLVASIRAKILSLPGDTVVWPGHGDRSTAGAEKKNNPYVGGA